MKNERRFVTLDEPEKIKQLVIEVWDSQGHLVIEPYGDNKVVYIPLGEKVDPYGRGYLIKAKNKASLICFVKEVQLAFEHFILSAMHASPGSIESAEVADRCGKIMIHLDSILT